jgi:hypothetical protein
MHCVIVPCNICLLTISCNWLTLTCSQLFECKDPIAYAVCFMRRCETTVVEYHFFDGPLQICLCRLIGLQGQPPLRVPPQRHLLLHRPVNRSSRPMGGHMVGSSWLRWQVVVFNGTAASVSCFAAASMPIFGDGQCLLLTGYHPPVTLLTCCSAIICCRTTIRRSHHRECGGAGCHCPSPVQAPAALH